MRSIGEADPVVSGKRSWPEAKGQIAAGQGGPVAVDHVPRRDGSFRCDHHTFSARDGRDELSIDDGNIFAVASVKMGSSPCVRRPATEKAASSVMTTSLASRMTLMPKWPSVEATSHFVKYLLSKNHRYASSIATSIGVACRLSSRLAFVESKKCWM